MKSKNPLAKRRLSNYIVIIMDCFPKQDIRKKIKTLEKALKISLVDADQKARAYGR